MKTVYQDRDLYTQIPINNYSCSDGKCKVGIIKNNLVILNSTVRTIRWHVSKRSNWVRNIEDYTVIINNTEKKLPLVVLTEHI